MRPSLALNLSGCFILAVIFLCLSHCTPNNNQANKLNGQAEKTNAVPNSSNDAESDNQVTVISGNTNNKKSLYLKPAVQPKVADWASFYADKIEALNTKDFNMLSNSLETERLSSNMDAESLRGFIDEKRSFLVFNADSSLALDIGSLNWVVSKNKRGKVKFSSDVDTEIALLDLKSATRTRLVFFGSAAWIDNGWWEDANNVILSGFMANDTLPNQYSPIVIRMNISTLEKTIFRHPKYASVNKDAYFEKFRLQNVVKNLK